MNTLVYETLIEIGTAYYDQGPCFWVILQNNLSDLSASFFLSLLSYQLHSLSRYFMAHMLKAASLLSSHLIYRWCSTSTKLGVNNHPSPRNPESSKQDKPKAKHPKTHINQINKDQTQRENIKSSKGKATNNTQGDPHMGNSWSINRNSSGQKGNDWT